MPLILGLRGIALARTSTKKKIKINMELKGSLVSPLFFNFKTIAHPLVVYYAAFNITIKSSYPCLNREAEAILF